MTLGDVGNVTRKLSFFFFSFFRAEITNERPLFRLSARASRGCLL